MQRAEQQQVGDTAITLAQRYPSDRTWGAQLTAVGMFDGELQTRISGLGQA